MHHSVISLLGYDVLENKWYGASKDGGGVVKSSSHSSRFIGAALSDWDTAKAKPTTVHAKMIGNDLAITNNTLTPNDPDHIHTSTVGTKWGGMRVSTEMFCHLLQKNCAVLL